MSEEKAKKVFAEFDKDGSGFIDARELFNVVRTMGFNDDKCKAIVVVSGMSYDIYIYIFAIKSRSRII